MWRLLDSSGEQDLLGQRPGGLVYLIRPASSAGTLWDPSWYAIIQSSLPWLMKSDPVPGQPSLPPSLLSSTETDKMEVAWNRRAGLMVFRCPRCEGKEYRAHHWQAHKRYQSPELSVIKALSLTAGTNLGGKKLPLTHLVSLPLSSSASQAGNLLIALRRHLGWNYRNGHGCFQDKSCKAIEKERDGAYVLRRVRWLMPTLAENAVVASLSWESENQGAVVGSRLCR